jgi:hypothetical protein
MRYAGIPYEGLDSTGKPEMREANVINELPHKSIPYACADAAKVIGKTLGLVPIRPIPFGAPVYMAFGLTQPEAKAHSQAKLLLTLGLNVALAHCG